MGPGRGVIPPFLIQFDQSAEAGPSNLMPPPHRNPAPHSDQSAEAGPSNWIPPPPHRNPAPHSDHNDV